MTSLHAELVEETKGGACRVCTYVLGLPPLDQAVWTTEIALPLTIVSHMALVVALKRRGVSITEASVRRHRSNHV